jgi:Fe-S cluster biogenesis protein NfuA/nitrite reductase/ring-hydroxylating ferredoxin subunit
MEAISQIDTDAGLEESETEPVHSPAQLIERVQQLQSALDEAGDSVRRTLADELVSAVVQMYGAGLERIVGSLLAAGPEGKRIAAGLTDEPLVSTLLLIHDLHPVPLADRVRAALDSVRPYMESHGGDVELLSLSGGVARLRLRGSCSDCSASSVTLELAIKQALEEAAPDLDGLEVEGVAPQIDGVELPMAAEGGSSGIELPMVISGGGPPPAPSWFDVELGELSPDVIGAVTVAGQELVIADVDGTLLAYRDKCAGCGHELHDGELSSGELSCSHCGRKFFLPRAGRALDDQGVQLEPVPLLREQGGVRVALAV